MTIEYALTETDFLNHQLYLASKSARIRKKRKKASILVTLIYAGFAVLSFLLNRPFMGGLFIVVAILWYFFYPLWERGHYFRHYRDFIKENYKERTDKLSTLEIHDDFLFSKSIVGEGKINTSEIEDIVELPTLILIRIETGQSFIITKERLEQRDQLIIRFKELAGHLGISYTAENTWKWQ